MPSLLKYTRCLPYAATLALCYAVLLQGASTKIHIGILTLYTETLEKLIDNAYKNELPANFDLKSFVSSTSFIADTYNQWLESADMVPVILDINSPDDELVSKIADVDGILLTGGRQPFYNGTAEGAAKIPSRYISKVGKIIAEVGRQNQRGNRIAMWATCLGFQAILIVESNFTIARHVVDNELKNATAISVVNYSTKSARFFNENELEAMNQLRVFYFNHKFGIYTRDFNENRQLRDKIDVVATITKDDTPIVAWIEYKSLPIIATQFHPEKFPLEKDLAQGDSLESRRFVLNHKFALLFKSLAKDRKRESFPKPAQLEHTIALHQIGVYPSIEVVYRLPET